MKIESVWEPDLHKEAELVYGTADQDHPAVNYMFNIGSHYLGGKIEKISMPKHYDYLQYRLSPDKVKTNSKKRLEKIVAFQTRNLCIVLISK